MQDMPHLFDLAQRVLDELKAKQYVLGTAESCTGGMLSMSITACAGSSEVFTQGIVSYSNEAKQRLLHVPAEVLETFGAVSQETARAMAKGVLSLDPQTDIAVSTTGIAGPGGATPNKPVGLVCFALATRQHCMSYEMYFSGDRQAVRMQATAFILQTLQAYLEKLEA